MLRSLTNSMKKAVQLTVPSEGWDGGREGQQHQERPHRRWRRSSPAGNQVYNIWTWNHQCSLVDWRVREKGTEVPQPAFTNRPPGHAGKEPRFDVYINFVKGGGY